LLEAMQELSVTVRGNTRNIEPPFFVLATQNPIELEGTYPLPEAQLDRFLFNVLLDYLNVEDELKVVADNTSRVEPPPILACTTAAEIIRFQWLVRQVPMSDDVARKAVALVRATRPTDVTASDEVKKYTRYGASIRATQFLALAAKARALSEGRYHVAVEDLAALALPVLRHRVLTNYQAESDGITTDQLLTNVVKRELGACAQRPPRRCCGRKYWRRCRRWNWSRVPPWRASSRDCTAVRASATARSSPPTRPMPRAMIRASSTGMCTRAPTGPTSSASRARPTRG
jgi:MoxR-like ATPase